MSIPAVTPVETPVVTPPVADAPAEGAPVVPPVEGEPKGDEAPPADEEGKTFDKAYVTKIREEAASWRTQFREAQEKFANAKTPEEFEAANKESAEKIAGLEQQLLVRDIATEFELPAELAAVLKGSTPEELKAHAKVLQKFAPAAPAATLTGGLDPTDGDDGEMDPRKLALRTRR